MSEQHEEPREDADEPQVQELSDEALDAVSGGKEASMSHTAPGG